MDASYDQKALAIYNIDQAIKYLQTLPEGSNDSVVSFEIEHPWIVQTGTVEMVENTEATNGNQYALTSKSATSVSYTHLQYNNKRNPLDSYFINLFL